MKNINKVPNEHFIEVEGIIDPAGFDLDGTLLAVEIVTHDPKRKYLVDDTPQGQALLKRLGHGIRVSGLVRTEDGLSIIKVIKVQALDH